MAGFDYGSRGLVRWRGGGLQSYQKDKNGRGPAPFSGGMAGTEAIFWERSQTLGSVQVDGTFEEEAKRGDLGEPFIGWFTTGVTCRELGISAQRLDRLIADNKCGAQFIRTPYGRLFDPVSVVEWKRERTR